MQKSHRNICIVSCHHHHVLHIVCAYYYDYHAHVKSSVILFPIIAWRWRHNKGQGHLSLTDRHKTTHKKKKIELKDKIN